VVNILGWQNQQWLDGRSKAWVKSHPPHTLKVIDVVAVPELTEWRSVRRDGNLIIRKYFPDESLDPTKIDATIALAQPVKHLAPILEVPINEAHQTGDSLAALAQYTIRAVQTFSAAGFRAAVGVFSEGNPPHIETDWPRFFPALRVTRQHRGYLALHEYFTPSCYLDGWHSVRYRKVWNLLPEDCRVPLLITEAGIDGGINCTDGNRPKTGWRSYVSATRYAEMLRGYHQQLVADPYVHGSTVFGLDMFDDWRDFEMGGADELRSLFIEDIPGPARWTIGGSTPVQPTPPATFNIEAERAKLWAIKDLLRANGWPRFAQAIEAAVTQSKGER
jgi:hypothetical protein